MTPGNAFATVLKNIRKSAGISQEALASESGLDRTYISLLERGLRQPSLSTIFQISASLKIKPFELIRLVSELVDEGTSK